MKKITNNLFPYLIKLLITNHFSLIVVKNLFPHLFFYAPHKKLFEISLNLLKITLNTSNLNNNLFQP